MDPFATLGMPRSFDVNIAAVEKTYRELSRALHPDRYLGASASERRAALAKAVEVNEAWRIVREPIRRAEALLALAGVAVGEGQREALSEAKRARDLDAVRRMADTMGACSRDVERALSEGFARGDLASLAGKVGELRFYRRFLDEVSAIEDELAA